LPSYYDFLTYTVTYEKVPLFWVRLGQRIVVALTCDPGVKCDALVRMF